MTSLPDQSNGMELVAELPPYRDGQIRAVWRDPSGNLVEISTVPETRSFFDDFLTTMAPIVDQIAPGDPRTEYMAARDSTLEETMAFPSDGCGRLSNREIVAAQGAGSRARVLEMLAAGVDWRTAR